jgi:hypothetical protein
LYLEVDFKLNAHLSFQYLEVHERIGKKLTQLSMQDQEMQQKAMTAAGATPT